jgi:hypothetical protein
MAQIQQQRLPVLQLVVVDRLLDQMADLVAAQVDIILDMAEAFIQVLLI